MFFKKSQLSLEYMVTVGVVLASVLAVYFLVYDRIYEKDDALEVELAEDAVRKIAESAEDVYYRGPPSKATLKLRYPDSAKKITSEDPNQGYWLLKMEIDPETGPKTISYPTKAPVRAHIPQLPGAGSVNYLFVQSEKTNLGEVFVRICESEGCPPVNGQCGLNNCASGNYKNLGHNSTHYNYACEGLSSGATANCSTLRSAVQQLKYLGPVFESVWDTTKRIQGSQATTK